MIKFPLSLILLLSTQAAMAYTLIEGTSTPFLGPDDLLLDPAANVIAVDLFGNGDSIVNGVQFFTDRDGSGTAVTAEGVVSSEGVTVTTGLVNQIDGWTAAPTFVGGTPDSAANLAEIMSDIRWANNGAGQILDVEITGLDSNVNYNIQLLFNEGADRDRRFDIAVNGLLAVDDISSKGGDGVWGPDNSFVYSGDFNSSVDGTLSIILGAEPLPDDPNNTPPAAADSNAILQAIIVHTTAPPSPADDITLDPGEFPAGVPIGTTVGTLSSSDPNGGSHTYSLVAGAGDTDNAKFQLNNDQLETAADFSALGGTDLSIRVRSTDEGELSFEKIITVTVSDDSDDDGLEDDWELMFGSLADFNGLANGPGPGAGTGDFDGDDSPDLDEFTNGTAPNDDDSDDDGLNDGEEADAGTDPLDEDTDKDGLKDDEEATHETDPLLSDTDGDTLLDGAEVDAGTDPTKRDTDGDGLDDNLDPAPLDPAFNSFTQIIVGEIIEFSGPDDLNLDPATNVIAVNSRGDIDLEVNGVTFLEDVSGGGVATNNDNGVTVTTTADNEIPGWATRPVFTGEDATSSENLGIIMESIRWNTAPGPVSIDISGLNPGGTYEIQLLTNEGADRNRQWDIAVEDELVVDNYTSEGQEGLDSWAENNSFAYAGEFEVPADGILNIVMQQHIGGIDPRGADNNPILQGVIVNETGPGTPFVISNLDYDPETGTSILTWTSRPGANYILEFSTTLLAPWIEVDDSIPSGGETTTFQDPIKRTGPVGFYRVSRAQ
jgi:hypothetical protein